MTDINEISDDLSKKTVQSPLEIHVITKAMDYVPSNVKDNMFCSEPTSSNCQIALVKIECLSNPIKNVFYHYPSSSNSLEF